jgi:hypothetical protein
MLNTYQGVIRGRQDTDWVLGVNSPISSKILNPSKNWTTSIPQLELQNKGYETYACTLFSSANCRETLMMYYLKNNLIPPDYVLWLTKNGYFENGFINFSDRLPAQFADISIGLGTSQYKANIAFKNHIIPEKLFPYELNGYYDTSKITQEMLNLGLEFEKRFVFNWNWIDDPEEGLLYSPLQGVVRWAEGGGILSPAGNPNHAIEIHSSNGSFGINDSYSQDIKKYAKDHVWDFIGYTLTINITTMDVVKFVKENDLKWGQNSNNGQFFRVMQGRLRLLNTSDRATLALLDDKVRENGIKLTTNEFDQFVQAKLVNNF